MNTQTEYFNTLELLEYLGEPDTQLLGYLSDAYNKELYVIFPFNRAASELYGTLNDDNYEIFGDDPVLEICNADMTESKLAYNSPVSVQHSLQDFLDE